MSITAVVGAQWGDEGKGKITDCLAAQADYAVRFQGGANAGHTIINDYGKFALHLLPSGVFYPHVTNVLGPGVALNLQVLRNELAELAARGVPAPKLKISNRAQVVLPYHMLLDAYEEARLGSQSFGSTQQGIAPFYADKYQKVGVQFGDLFDAPRLRTKLENALQVKNVLIQHLYQQPALTADALVADLLDDAKHLAPYICDTTELLQTAHAAGQHILLEGQLGALRDPDHGIYPYSTSSSPLAGFGSVGAGVPPYAIRQIVAVVKAYSSCVGAGPFVTEIEDDAGETLRRLGGDAGEYGATTGRPRRVGWFDAVATRYGCRIQGATAVALTNLDVLSYLDEIPLCIGYAVNGVEVQYFPTTTQLVAAQPCFEYLPGWRTDLTQARRWADLPVAAQAYIARVEELIDTPIRWVGVGPTRDALIARHIASGV